LERTSESTAALVDLPPVSEAAEPQSPPAEQNELNESVSAQKASRWLDDMGIPILRATRSWIQYGTVGFAVMCILIGALEGLLGR
jgi:hypothetical protein